MVMRTFRKLQDTLITARTWDASILNLKYSFVLPLDAFTVFEGTLVIFLHL